MVVRMATCNDQARRRRLKERSRHFIWTKWSQMSLREIYRPAPFEATFKALLGLGMLLAFWANFIAQKRGAA